MSVTQSDLRDIQPNLSDIQFNLSAILAQMIFAVFHFSLHIHTALCMCLRLALFSIPVHNIPLLIPSVPDSS